MWHRISSILTPRIALHFHHRLTPSAWLADNFANNSAVDTAEARALCQVMGILCACIAAFTMLIRSNEVCLKPTDQIAAATWGACAALTYSHQALYKPTNFKINMCIQAGLAAAFVYQASTRGGKGKKN